jgi:hypothetical protein
MGAIFETPCIRNSRERKLNQCIQATFWLLTYFFGSKTCSKLFLRQKAKLCLRLYQIKLGKLQIGSSLKRAKPCKKTMSKTHFFFFLQRN